MRIGYVERDFQIQIGTTNLDPPVLILPEDTCVAAGTILVDSVWGYDEQNLTVSLDFYGSALAAGATMSLNSIQNDSVIGVFQLGT